MLHSSDLMEDVTIQEKVIRYCRTARRLIYCSYLRLLLLTPPDQSTYDKQPTLGRYQVTLEEGYPHEL